MPLVMPRVNFKRLVFREVALVCNSSYPALVLHVVSAGNEVTEHNFYLVPVDEDDIIFRDLRNCYCVCHVLSLAEHNGFVSVRRTTQ